MKKSLLWIPLLIVAPLRLCGETGRTALLVLNQSYGARTHAMGQALVADLAELDTMGINPAGMARLDRIKTSATYQQGLADDSLGFINVGIPSTWGAVFGGLSYLDGGPIDLHLSDGTNESRTSQKDIVGHIGMALGQNSPVSWGITGKMFKSELAETETAQGTAMDTGLSWQALSFLRLAASVQNLGSDISYASSEDKLSTTFRYGGSLTMDTQNKPRWNDFFQNRYQLNFDSIKPRDEKLSGNVGLEIRRDFGPDNLPYQASFRAGYIGATYAPTLGAGFRAGRFLIDYGINFVDAIDNAHRITLTFLFGGENGKPSLRSKHL